MCYAQILVALEVLGCLTLEKMRALPSLVTNNSQWLPNSLLNSELAASPAWIHVRNLVSVLVLADKVYQHPDLEEEYMRNISSSMYKAPPLRAPKEKKGLLSNSDDEEDSKQAAEDLLPSMPWLAQPLRGRSLLRLVTQCALVEGVIGTWSRQLTNPEIEAAIDMKALNERDDVYLLEDADFANQMIIKCAFQHMKHRTSHPYTKADCEKMPPRFAYQVSYSVREP